MATATSRARSSTSGSTSSSRPRAISRASTTSITTTSAPPPQQYQEESETTYPQPNDSHASQFTAEEMITRSEHQLTNPDQEYALDPSLQDHASAARSMSVDHAYHDLHNNMRPIPNHRFSYDGQGASQFATVNFQDDQTQDESGNGDMRKKKGSASSIANDQELRRLFAENNHRDLKEVASAVLANERGPKSEKTKQIFAMNWLNTVCQKSNSSVPRNRVFSHYATRCGTERVPPLNPASFGKLVRIIFPGIQTRRLGMRGESKYHYVDLALIDDRLDVFERNQHLEYGVGATENAEARKPRAQLPADTAVFPLPDIQMNTNYRLQEAPRLNAAGCLYLDPAIPNIQQGPSAPNMVLRQLKFPSYQEPPYVQSEPIELPGLQNHLPAGTDPDSANALIALYRSHCISVIDCFRFCKEKMFWHLFTSFHGTLTVPVQKLLAHPDIANWVKECDWLMYQKMIRFVSPLALQVMPPKVIDTFRNISAKLGSHISNTFSNHPQHVRDAKLGPATIFAGLINRLLRVNATAHATANILTNDANRDQMWYDWVCCVKAVSVIESSLSNGGYTRTLKILTNDVRELLGPLRATSYQGMQPIYANTAATSNPKYLQHGHPELDDSSTSGVLDRWTTFLQDLPSRFPGVDARVLLHCAGEVSSAALRDITMATAPSFGSWWVTKVWVDEMLQWLAEKGGFLENPPTTMEMRPKKRSVDEAGFSMDERDDIYGGSRPRTGYNIAAEAHGRLGSVDMRDKFHHDQVQNNHPVLRDAYSQPPPSRNGGVIHANRTQTPPMTDRLPSYLAKETQMDHGHDDSGIGLDFESFPPQTSIRLQDYGAYTAHNGNTGSDPADVIVC